MKVAVIGGGIAGNVAAYHLSKDHDVRLFEAGDHLGGHTHTHDLEWQGKPYSVDTGFIVFNDRTYPNFMGLLDEMGVKYQPTEMSFSVRSDARRLEYNGNSLNTLFAQRRNLFRPVFIRMIREIMRFNREAPQDYSEGKADISLGEYLLKNCYSSEFTNLYIIPMGAAIWSTDPLMMKQFPAAFFIRFFINHGLLEITNRPQWYVIQGGSKQYLEPMKQGYAEGIRLNTPVESVSRIGNGVQITTKAFGKEMFDAVVIATHSDQALRLLQDPTIEETEVLGAIPYQGNQALLHTDSSVMPKRSLAWASWNYHIGQSEDKVTLSYDMNRLQNIQAPVNFLVTLNNAETVDPDKVIKELYYEHPLYTEKSVNAQARRHEISGCNRTFYCGAYWGNGFHEDGVVSALKAVEEFKELEHELMSLSRAS
ncbi:MAG: NAD(P)-binding protein [Gammaproteobacteria bacterium]|nr:NAD(P)-binding protein [Gammaproteobacteria bacterium]